MYNQFTFEGGNVNSANVAFGLSFSDSSFNSYFSSHFSQTEFDNLQLASKDLVMKMLLLKLNPFLESLPFEQSNDPSSQAHVYIYLLGSLLTKAHHTCCYDQ